MKITLWVAFFVVILVAVFAVQNSGTLVSIRFLFWKFETSLVYTIMGSAGLGILLTLLFWIPREIRSSFRKSKPPQEATPDSISKST